MYYNILGLSFLPNKRKYFLYYLSGGNYKKKAGGQQGWEFKLFKIPSFKLSWVQYFFSKQNVDPSGNQPSCPWLAVARSCHPRPGIRLKPSGGWIQLPKPREAKSSHPQLGVARLDQPQHKGTRIWLQIFFKFFYIVFYQVVLIFILL